MTAKEIQEQIAQKAYEIGLRAGQKAGTYATIVTFNELDKRRPGISLSRGIELIEEAGLGS